MLIYFYLKTFLSLHVKTETTIGFYFYEFFFCLNFNLLLNKARFIVVGKVCFENFYENVSEILTGYDCYGCKGYNSLRDFFFDFDKVY